MSGRASPLRPRDGENDGGYAVEDYDAVDPHVGTMADLRALAGDLHERGIAPYIDLVLNHTAREHPWARRALAGEPGYREMYLIFPGRTEPDAYERTLPEVFPGLGPPQSGQPANVECLSSQVRYTRDRWWMALRGPRKRVKGQSFRGLNPTSTAVVQDYT